ncbi:hypothetical protein [Streptomyces sp. NPDC094149]|uniref:hypothetical protein n=1 Tax=Streptomyces sp. NPDC094149 TaxID=3155079 RepID=UPI0033323ADC
MPEPTAPLSEEAAKDEAERLIRAAYQPTAVRIDDPAIPSYKDGPRIGDTAPVAQPDSRLVPQWALGLAVGSVGVGAGVTFIGCGVWLACKGLASVVHSLSTVTLNGVLLVTLPIAGLAMAVTAIGGAVSKARKAAKSEVHHHHGPEYHETKTDRRRAIWQKDVDKRRH